MQFMVIQIWKATKASDEWKWLGWITCSKSCCKICYTWGNGWWQLELLHSFSKSPLCCWHCFDMIWYCNLTFWILKGCCWNLGSLLEKLAMSAAGNLRRIYQFLHHQHLHFTLYVKEFWKLQFSPDVFNFLPYHDYRSIVSFFLFFSFYFFLFLIPKVS